LRAEPYSIGQIPAGVLCLTAGVDVQDDRLAVELVGWGAGRESWSLLWEEWYGDPAKAELWERLDAILGQSFTCRLGPPLTIGAMCIDSGGHFTQKVYDFCKPRISRRVFAVKGRAGAGRPIATHPNRSGSANNTKLVIVGVDTAKSHLYAWLRLEWPQGCTAMPGYCHFPQGHPSEYYSQLTAEVCRLKYLRGFAHRVWELPNGRRNEALDCRVYAMAALDLLKPNWEALAKRQGEAATAPQPQAQADGETPRAPDMAMRRRLAGGGSWATRW